jgi:SAM-dependent methyltransferase
MSKNNFIHNSPVVEFLRDGSATLKKVNSPINGELTVKWDLLSGYQIMGGGLWQVGGPVETVWKAGMKEIKKRGLDLKDALILGVGGGTTAKLIRENWPDANITGIDIDPLIIQLGEEYLGLKKLNVNLVVSDAFVWTKKNNETFDVVCIDTYVGDTFPPQFASVEFLKQVKSSVRKDGVAIFNRIFESNERKASDGFLKSLKAVFTEVKEVYPSHELLNVLFVCS